MHGVGVVVIHVDLQAAVVDQLVLADLVKPADLMVAPDPRNPVGEARVVAVQGEEFPGDHVEESAFVEVAAEQVRKRGDRVGAVGAVELEGSAAVQLRKVARQLVGVRREVDEHRHGGVGLVGLSIDGDGDAIGGLVRGLGTECPEAGLVQGVGPGELEVVLRQTLVPGTGRDVEHDVDLVVSGVEVVPVAFRPELPLPVGRTDADAGLLELVIHQRERD